ncbi:MAG: F0F1 ATP synthase subunit A [Actinobacteria bacterium]|nr:F0F1 ATP synthase subunit A [Actinomycetota bacterium]
MSIPTWLAAFEPPTTKDFVFDPWFGPVDVFGVELEFNFITFLALLAVAITVAFFWFGLRKPQVVPGKFQAVVETGIEFVREQIQMSMIGPEGARFLPLLLTLFFLIFFGNILEVVPGISFPVNSRLAFPLVPALIVWLLYNALGIKKHGFFGYFKMVMFPPGAPALMYVLLAPIEFVTGIIMRPITLTVRLFANMVAGHFLLAVFFLGSIAAFQGAGLVKLVGPISFLVGTGLIAFEIFVAGLQAFIFTILTASYIGGALAEEH